MTIQYNVARQPWQFTKKRRVTNAVQVHSECPACKRPAPCQPNHWSGFVEHVMEQEPCTWEEVIDQNLQEYKSWLHNQTLIHKETNKILQEEANKILQTFAIKNEEG